MHSFVSHLQFNVRRENLVFYRELLTFLGWRTVHEDEGGLGVAGTHQQSLWFIGEVKEVANDYDVPGLNHVAIGTTTEADVDATAAYLTDHGIKLLFGTPQHRSEFSAGDDQTYYQVMFESPDRILIEVVYIGPKVAAANT